MRRCNTRQRSWYYSWKNRPSRTSQGEWARGFQVLLRNEEIPAAAARDSPLSLLSPSSRILSGWSTCCHRHVEQSRAHTQLQRHLLNNKTEITLHLCSSASAGHQHIREITDTTWRDVNASQWRRHPSPRNLAKKLQLRAQWVELVHQVGSPALVSSLYEAQ